MEGRRRDEEEEARRKIDQRRMKKLKERELDQAVNLYNKTTNLLNLKKTKMMLPDPQLKDQDLELLGKLNAVNEVSEHTNQATRALVGNYSQRESTASVMRTPRAPNTVMREA
jgi:pre-mRNA-splicing factor CDC5/CEF1